jgi:hypothetical protein
VPRPPGVLGDGVDDTGPDPDDATGVERIDPADHLRRRRDLIHARNRELQDRIRELAERREHGPRPDEAQRAREHADEARDHARVAHEHAAVSHDEAADVHLRVADALDVLGHGDRAQEHRAAAAADRSDAVTERAAAERDAVGKAGGSGDAGDGDA